MYYYTYLLINPTTDKMYIGQRHCKCHPNDDINYMGSSKHVPTNECDKIVLSIFTASEEALKEEIELHAKYNIAVNPNFYNKAKQTSIKFDTTGTTFKLSKAHCKNISKATTGVPKNLTKEQHDALKYRISKIHTTEIREKAASTLRKNGSNKGIKNSQFSPWYISTDKVTYLFTDISKYEKAIQDGFKSKKHYIDLQRKLKGTNHKHKIYGSITAIGNLPKQYKI